MKLLVACTILALLGVVYSQCMASRHFSDADESWDFTGYAAAEVRGVTLDSRLNEYSFIVKFCTNVNAIFGNISNPNKPQKDWIGWNHGVLESFTYVGMEMHNPNTAAEDQVAPRIAKKSFEQDFVLGDHGYPCLTGRKSTLFVHCGQAGDTCASVPGLSNQHCLDYSMPTSGKLCMCDIGLDADGYACGANLTLLLIDCPSVYISPNAQGPQAAEPLSGGAVFGIIVLVLFLVTLVICAGGFAYNYKVNDLRGVDAVPFISVFRGSARDRPYQPASQSGYGSVEESN